MGHLVTTLTTDQPKFMSVMAKIEPDGECRFTAAVRVAQLSLKHRMNKNHKQRIVVFVCSPVQEEEKELVKVAAFINTLNGKDGGTSHLVSIPSGTSLDQALRKSPIIDGGESSGAGMGGMDDPMGIDAANDPELAMALRISLEEQRARQQQDGGNAGESQQAETEAQPMDDDTAVLREALTMSMGGGAGGGMDDLGGMTEEEQIEMAIRMSMQQDAAPQEEPMATEEAADSQQLVTDPEFLRQVISNLPDVDPDSDAVKEAMGEKKEEDKKE